MVWKSKQGFSLVQILIALGLFSVVTMVFTSLFVQSKSQQIQSSSFYSIEQIRRNLSTMLANSAVWNQTVQMNASLKCLQTPGTPKCIDGAKIDFVIYSAGGAAYFDAKTQGFQFDGSICLLTEPACAIQMTMQAVLTCPTGVDPCDKPDSVFAQGLFTQVIFPGGQAPFNPANYAVKVREDAAAAATGAGIWQIKCAYQVPGNLGAPNPGCVGLLGPGLPLALLCSPNVCPSGFSDAGISSEITGSLVRDAGNTLLLGNCVRSCYQ